MALGASYLLNVGPNGNGVITKEYEERLLAVGDWYTRMEGILECAEEDCFDYQIKDNGYIATRKNGKTYLHFFDGLITNAVTLKQFPSKPKKIRLLNTGELLKYDVMYLPELFRGSFDQLSARALHIFGIDFAIIEKEPVVIEIEW
jgi:hypothetical protein